jgi:hypothetical protein
MRHRLSFDLLRAVAVGKGCCPGGLRTFWVWLRTSLRVRFGIPVVAAA